jgi:sigma-B regulation protein RsbU (phosphoserine phosphatase)
MKDDLSLAKLVYDTKVKNDGVIYCFVLDDQKMVWAHTDVSLVNTQYTTPAELKPLGNDTSLTQSYKTPDGIEVFEIAMPITVGQNKIGEAHVAISQDAIKRAVGEARKGMALVTIIIIALGIIGILLLVSFIIGSLGNVTDDIEAIGNGDLDRRIVTRRKDEIGRIAHAVKTMAGKLKIARKELVEKERMKKEMQIAHEIQQTLLPQTIPDVPGFKIDAYYQAAMEVGGDYYDIVTIDDEHVGFVIADVSGKGVAGSLVMTMVRSLIRLEATKNLSPRQLLILLNTVLSDDIPEGMFITLYYVVCDLKEQELCYCCAGHNPAYFFNSKENQLASLKPKGPPLGIGLFNEEEYASRLQEERKQFNAGDTLLIYTDGVTEAMNKHKEQFGEERLEEIIKAHAHETPDKLKQYIINEIEHFTGKAPQSDDITFVILKKLQTTD